eukprot:Nk52_evm20s2402 gene=Nk52_evmTU20s2402
MPALKSASTEEALEEMVYEVYYNRQVDPWTCPARNYFFGLFNGNVDEQVDDEFEQVESQEEEDPNGSVHSPEFISSRIQSRALLRNAKDADLVAWLRNRGTMEPATKSFRLIEKIFYFLVTQKISSSLMMLFYANLAQKFNDLIVCRPWRVPDPFDGVHLTFSWEIRLGAMGFFGQIEPSYLGGFDMSQKGDDSLYPLVNNVRVVNDRLIHENVRLRKARASVLTFYSPTADFDEQSSGQLDEQPNSQTKMYQFGAPKLAQKIAVVKEKYSNGVKIMEAADLKNERFLFWSVYRDKSANRCGVLVYSIGFLVYLTSNANEDWEAESKVGLNAGDRGSVQTEIEVVKLVLGYFKVTKIMIQQRDGMDTTMEDLKMLAEEEFKLQRRGMSFSSSGDSSEAKTDILKRLPKDMSVAEARVVEFRHPHTRGRSRAYNSHPPLGRTIKLNHIQGRQMSGDDGKAVYLATLAGRSIVYEATTSDVTGGVIDDDNVEGLVTVDKRAYDESKSVFPNDAVTREQLFGNYVLGGDFTVEVYDWQCSNESQTILPNARGNGRYQVVMQFWDKVDEKVKSLLSTWRNRAKTEIDNRKRELDGKTVNSWARKEIYQVKYGTVNPL